MMNTVDLSRDHSSVVTTDSIITGEKPLTSCISLYSQERHSLHSHFSTTCLPIPSHSILHGDDEEDHPDPEWLRIKTSKMIDDFTDVNAGEKEFMKMWNNHVQKFT